MMFPKPPKTERKPKKRVKRYRAKARKGRLRGNPLEALRLACFERDGYRCVDCGMPVRFERGYPDSGDMAHVGAKRRYGDNLPNVRTKCFTCHRIIEHRYGPTGLKPCPPEDSKV